MGEQLVALLPDTVNALAGLELGSVPLAVAASQLPTVFVRKQAQRYGTSRLAEGVEVSGVTLAAIEDVETSGGQIIEFCAALRDLGTNIAVLLCVVDREAGGRENIARAGLELRSLFTTSTLEGARAVTDRACRFRRLRPTRGRGPHRGSRGAPGFYRDAPDRRTPEMRDAIRILHHPTATELT